MYKIISRSLSREATSAFPLTPFKERAMLSSRFIEFKVIREKHSKVYALGKHWFSKYTDYVKDLQKKLEKSFPKSMHIYRVFSIGTKDFYNDLKYYFIVKKKKSLLGIGKLTSEELRALHKMPKDIMKLTPFLLTAALPFANYIVFPLGYYFPKIFLTSQYWDLKQRLDFALIDHKTRLKHNKPLLRCVQAGLNKIEDQTLRRKWNEIIATLGSGRHPTPEHIIECKLLFQGAPYSLNSLGRKHLVQPFFQSRKKKKIRFSVQTNFNHCFFITAVFYFQRELLAIHKMIKWLPYKRQRLMDRGMFIKRMDTAIEAEGGVSKLPTDALRWVGTSFSFVTFNFG